MTKGCENHNGSPCVKCGGCEKSLETLHKVMGQSGITVCGITAIKGMFVTSWDNCTCPNCLKLISDRSKKRLNRLKIKKQGI
jgi:hypothetical protein